MGPVLFPFYLIGQSNIVFVFKYIISALVYYISESLYIS